jgi:hypothetical protein
MQLQSTLTQLEFCNLLNAAGFDAASLKAAGFDAASLKAAGFDAASLKAAGFDAAAFRAAGYDWSTIRAAGFSVANAKAAASALAAGFYDMISLLTAYGHDAVKAAGCDVSCIVVSSLMSLVHAHMLELTPPTPHPAARWSLLLHYSSLSQS